MTLKQKYKLTKKNNDYYLSFRNKIFKINQYYYFLLSAQKDVCDFPAQLTRLKSNFSLSDNQVELISSEFRKFILKLDKVNVKKDRTYIKFKRVLFKRKLVEKLAGKLKFLFNSVILLLTGSLIILINIYFIFTNSLKGNLHLNWKEYFVLLFGIFLLAIIHELGHASALMKCRQKPNEIGVGIYFIFPVFYSNITSAWLLPRKEKIMINVGGIYFQLLVNALLVLLIILPVGIPQHQIQIIRSFILLNISIVIYNLLPFLRQDGYWIYADLFSVSNLMYRADRIHREFSLSKARENLPVLIYSIANWFFRIYMIVILTGILLNNLPKFHQLNFTKDFFGSCFLLLISCFGLFLMIKHIVEILTNKTVLNEGY